MKSDAEPKVAVNWRFTDGKLSSTWLRLVAKLTASRREKPGSTRPDSEDGGLKNGNERIVPDE